MIPDVDNYTRNIDDGRSVLKIQYPILTILIDTSLTYSILTLFIPSFGIGNYGLNYLGLKILRNWHFGNDNWILWFGINNFIPIFKIDNLIFSPGNCPGFSDHLIWTAIDKMILTWFDIKCVNIDNFTLICVFRTQKFCSRQLKVDWSTFAFGIDNFYIRTYDVNHFNWQGKCWYRYFVLPFWHWFSHSQPFRSR